jgi:ribonuclease HII/SAM-dependent methyltransferase
MKSSLRLSLILFISYLLILAIIGYHQQGLLCHAALALPTGSSRRIKPLFQRDDPFSVEAGLLKKQQFTYILGSDESGVGCIAGPIVCVSCCILNATKMIAHCPVPVRDGKSLSADECQQIRRYADDNNNAGDIIRYVATTRSNLDIDQLGIYQCVQDGFRESIQSLVQQLLGENTTDDHGGANTDDIDDTTRRIEIANNNNNKNKEKKKMICSIVDGQRSPSFPDFTSRPWPQADATVYTVAVAGCLARALHAEIMADYQTQQFASSDNANDDDDDSSSSSSKSTSFRDRWDGGYPTPGHLLALATHGPTPWHRQSCKPVQQFRDTTRRSTLLSALSLLPFLLTTTTTVMMSSDPANAMVRERGMLLPERGEVASAVPTDWSEIDAIKEPLGRLDDNDDAIFYQDERFVEHIDDTAVQALRAYLATVVDSPTLSVLDVGASWTSHLEESTIIISNQQRKVVGIGLNANELAANPVLSDRLVQNLNIKTTLPLDSDSFDICLCQLTIDYLTRPITVCKELRRVLKKQKEPTAGMIHVVFSNRLFLQKAVDNWTGRDDLDHVETVASYLHYAGFRNIKAQDLSIRNKRGSIVGDPLYVVRAVA